MVHEEDDKGGNGDNSDEEEEEDFSLFTMIPNYIEFKESIHRALPVSVYVKTMIQNSDNKDNGDKSIEDNYEATFINNDHKTPSVHNDNDRTST